MTTIKTSFVYPPIPDRRFDWSAYVEGDEESGRYGYGATEAEAIADFIENYAEEYEAMTLATILHLKRKMWTASRILSGLGREPSHELDVAGDAYINALGAYRMAVLEAWGARCDRRLDASIAQMVREHVEGRVGSIRIEERETV